MKKGARRSPRGIINSHNLASWANRITIEIDAMRGRVYNHVREKTGLIAADITDLRLMVKSETQEFSKEAALLDYADTLWRGQVAMLEAQAVLKP